MGQSSIEAFSDALLSVAERKSKESGLNLNMAMLVFSNKAVPYFEHNDSQTWYGHYGSSENLPRDEWMDAMFDKDQTPQCKEVHFTTEDIASRLYGSDCIIATVPINEILETEWDFG